MPGLITQLWRGLKSALTPPRPWVVVDGSNVLYWQRRGPDLGSVAVVVAGVTARGLAPLVWFDANIGARLGDASLGAADLAARLGLPADRIALAPRGTPADPLLLAQARDLEARVVSNDQFRQWQKAHPEIRNPGRLVRGRIDREAPSGQGLWLDLPQRPRRLVPPR